MSARRLVTPGTRLGWSTGREWAAVHAELDHRRISAKVYRDLRAHLEVLAAEPGFVAVQSRADLDAIEAIVRKDYRPPHGQRGGTSYELVINLIDAARARLDRPARQAAARARRVAEIGVFA